jgi:DNA-binding transcriptional LysR family regulator
VDQALAGIGHFSPPDYEAGYISTALGMVEAGLGITILLISTANEPEPRTGKPADSGPGIGREVGLIQMRGRSLSKAAEAFQLAIRGKCAELYSRRQHKEFIDGTNKSYSIN